MIKKVVVKRGREKSLKRFHPWVFSGAIKDVDGNPQRGDIVEVCSERGEYLATGSYSPQSQITVRAWSFDKNERINGNFFNRRTERALRVRKAVINENAVSAYRVIHSESDGLPGLTVDRYGDFLVCQFLSAGVERWREEIVGSLQKLHPWKGIFERSDVDVRQKEGLEPRMGLITGAEPPEKLEVSENGVRFFVDVRKGHKTGFYLDQRENRKIVSQNVRGLEVLNCFSYTGGFGVSALAGKAKKVTNLDSSEPVIAMAEENLKANGFHKDLFENLIGDAFHVLRVFREQGKKFDAIVLDPPKFVESQKHLPKGARGYKDINMLAFQILKPGGFLFTFSCSGLVEMDLFQKIVADAALDAGRRGRLLRHLEQASCHPVALNFPEGNYLKGLMVHVE